MKKVGNVFILSLKNLLRNKWNWCCWIRCSYIINT